MGLRLLLYLAVLLIGGFIGYKGKISEKIMNKLNLIQTICLLFLLMVMGITIGIDEKVISSFFTIGFKAIVISIFTIGFSIIGIYLLSRFVLKRRDKIES